MISEIYKNSLLYYNMMKEFLSKIHPALTLQGQYFIQRDKDLDTNKINGYTDYYLNRALEGKEKIFEKEYFDFLYKQAWSINCLDALKKYEKGANELDIKGEIFFMGIWNFIDEYIREYNPSDAEYFDPKNDVDESSLQEKIQASFDILERNKDRWSKFY